MSDRRSKSFNNDSGHSSTDNTEKSIRQFSKKKSFFMPKSDTNQNVSTPSEHPASAIETGKKEIIDFLLSRNIEMTSAAKAKLTSLTSGEASSDENSQRSVALDVRSNTTEYPRLQESSAKQVNLDIDKYFKDQ